MIDPQHVTTRLRFQRLRSALLVVLLGLFSPLVSAQWSTPGLIATSPGIDHFLALGQSQTSMQRTFAAPNSDTLHVVWMMQTPGADVATITNIYYQHSFDGGATWSDTIPLTYVTAGDTSHLNPCLSVSGSTVHVVWLYGDNSNFRALGALYRRSDDAGNTWSDAVMIAPGYRGELGGLNPMIVAAGNRLHVSWSGFANSPGDFQAKSFYCSSEDNGQTWSTPVLVSDPGTNLRCIQTALAVSGNTVHLAWAAMGSQERTFIYYRKSPDNGVTWDEQQQLETDNDRSFAPCLAVTSDSIVHLAWEDNTSGSMMGNWSILYRRSPDGGTTWEPAQTMDEGIAGDFSTAPFLQAYGSQIHLTYNRKQSTFQYDIHYRKSLDGGATWRPDQMLMNGGLMPSMAANSSRLYLVYAGQFFDYISFISTAQDTANHVPSSFDLLQPAQHTLLTAAEADTVHFVWQRSTDPDNGQPVWYEFLVRVTPRNGAPVDLYAPNVTDTVYTLLLLGEAGFSHPTDTLSVDWWVLATSNGDTVHCGSTFHFRVLPVPSHSDIPERPADLDLIEAYPNPFNAAAVLRFTVGSSQRVRIQIFDILGNEMAVLTDRFYQAGSYSLPWNAANFPTGMYFCRMSMRNAVEKTVKLMLIK
jgi:hypothetical protein